MTTLLLATSIVSVELKCSFYAFMNKLNTIVNYGAGYECYACCGKMVTCA